MPVQLAMIVLIVCPLLICEKVVYLRNDHYDFVSTLDTFGCLWMTLGSYGIPLVYISSICIRIMLFIHRQTNNLTLIAQRRDLLAVKRILITIIVLAMVAIPGLILCVISLIENVEYPFTQRFMCFSREIGVAIGTIGVIWITPQLKSIITGLWQQNRIVLRRQLNQITPATTN